MKDFKICSLATNESVWKRFQRWNQNKPVDERLSDDELADYIIEHADRDEEHASVYVGTYGKYNSGSLYGMWVDLESFDSQDDFIEFCNALHADEMDPELMYQDYQNFPSNLYCESSIKEFFEYSEEYKDIDNREALDTYLNWKGSDASAEDFEDCFQGEAESEEDFAYNFVEEMYFDLPPIAKQYFDYKGFAYDLFINDFYFDNGFVFSRY